MSKNNFAKALAILLTITLIAPSVFLVAPQRAQAQWITFDPTNWIQTTITAIQTTISAIAEPITSVATVAEQVNTYVLQPLAFILSGNLMKALTSSVISFVTGKANGTGVPQFVVDVKRSLQTVGDSQALAYLKQVGMTNSPFAGSISSALRNDYMTKTSLAGFWSANMNTLARSSPDVPAYLAGNWSQGGVKAWFALTTQTQNDPYSLYQHTQAQLAAVVGSGAGGATDVRKEQLNWGQGFMSWCGTTDTVPPGAQRQIFDDGSTLVTDSGGGTTATNAIGINPGDACTNSDGTLGTTKTPGSVIKATLDKVLGGQQDKILRMGNVGGQITDLLGKIGSIVNTVQFASSILGGKDSGGLFGVDSTSSANPTSRLKEFQPTYDSSGNFTSGYGGVTNNQVYGDAAASLDSETGMSVRIARYQSAWDTIKTSTETASTSVASLASFCIAAADTAALAIIMQETYGYTTSPTPAELGKIHSIFIDAARAQATTATSTLVIAIAPVFAQITASAAIVVNANAMMQKVQSELIASTTSAGSTYAADFKTLQTMPPSIADIGRAMQQAQVPGQAIASPVGSLNVSGSFLADQMNLLSTNAEALKVSVCTLGGGVDTGGG